MNSLSTQPYVEKRVLAGWGRGAAGAFLAVVIAGCAAMAPKTPEQLVKERSQARWDALVKGDMTAAYEYFSPGSRAVVRPESFAASLKPGFWKSAVVEKVACEGTQTCEAQATIEYEYQGRRMKTPLRETWIREGSDWWYVQK